MESRFALATTLFTLLLGTPLWAQVAAKGATNEAGNPKELGKVRWLRDYDEAVARSNKTGKPIFLFFQEVPG